MDIIAAKTLDGDGRTALARRYVDAAESWLRKLIHHQLQAHRGDYYLTAGGVLKTAETKSLQAKIASDPAKYPREVDATSFEQAQKIVCHCDRWEPYFATMLGSAYPLGYLECQHFLNRLISVRNDLQHGRTCSARGLEQAICYTNDLSDAIKAFFREQNMTREYDVPMFVKYVDSLGNQSTLENVSTVISSRIIDWRTNGIGDLRPGDTLVAEVTVDPTFDRAGYSVNCSGPGSDAVSGSRLTLHVENRHIGEQLEIKFQVKTDRDWHRDGHQGIDDGLTLLFRVLPPLP